jgi:hypothetical protein
MKLYDNIYLSIGQSRQQLLQQNKIVLFYCKSCVDQLINKYCLIDTQQVACHKSYMNVFVSYN